MAKQNTMDLTQGRPIKQILLFSLPLVMGTLFQQLYSFMDTVMVGRLISEEALAAVGTTYSLNFLTLGFVQGACVGFGIPLAQSIGAKDSEGFKRYFWNGVWLCCILHYHADRGGSQDGDMWDMKCQKQFGAYFCGKCTFTFLPNRLE